MELEELRSGWRSLAEKGMVPEPTRIPTGERGRSPVQRMLHNLYMEAVFVMILYGFVIAFYLFAFHGAMREISWFTLAIFAVFLIYYIGKARLLRSLGMMDGSLRANVGAKLDALSRYTRFYVWAGTMLGPLTMIFLGWLAWHKIPQISPENMFFISDQNPWWKAMLTWLTLALPLTVALYFINRWYVDRLYGRHLRHLRRIWEEMREDLSTNLQP